MQSYNETGITFHPPGFYSSTKNLQEQTNDDFGVGNKNSKQTLKRTFASPVGQKYAGRGAKVRLFKFQHLCVKIHFFSIFTFFHRQRRLVEKLLAFTGCLLRLLFSFLFQLFLEWCTSNNFRS